MGWEVFPIPLDDVSQVSYPDGGQLAQQHRRLLRGVSVAASALLHVDADAAGPTFYRGTLTIKGDAAKLTTDAGGETHLPDSYIDLQGWGKTVAWVNNFNLGWGWPATGPQMTLYVPGPILREGDNEVVLMEVEAQPKRPQGKRRCAAVPLCSPLSISRCGAGLSLA